MQNEIEEKVTCTAVLWPCLMRAECGTIFLMSNLCCGLVLAVGSNQVMWKVGSQIDNLKASQMSMFEGKITVWN